MPRFIDVDTIIFTNSDGNSYSVKDTREISTQTLNFEIEKNENDLLDEIASRPEVYGNFGEIQSYRIFDLNIIKLTEANFDISKVKRIKIPL